MGLRSRSSRWMRRPTSSLRYWTRFRPECWLNPKNTYAITRTASKLLTSLKILWSAPKGLFAPFGAKRRRVKKRSKPRPKPQRAVSSWTLRRKTASACTADSRPSIAGCLRRRIKQKGKIMSGEVSGGFELEPGGEGGDKGREYSLESLGREQEFLRDLIGAKCPRSWPSWPRSSTAPLSSTPPSTAPPSTAPGR